LFQVADASLCQFQVQSKNHRFSRSQISMPTLAEQKGDGNAKLRELNHGGTGEKTGAFSQRTGALNACFGARRAFLDAPRFRGFWPSAFHRYRAGTRRSGN
jgi:hypothetical protein